MQNRKEREREVEMAFRILRKENRKDLLFGEEASVCVFYLYAW